MKGAIFALTVLVLASWAYSVGLWQVEVEREFLVSHLPMVVDAHHPLGPEAAPASNLLATLTRLLGGEAALLRSLMGLCQGLSLVVLFLGLLGWRGRWLPALLAVSLGFCWGAEGWLFTSSPNFALGHLLLATALIAWLRQQVWPAVALGVCLTLAAPPLAWSFVLGILIDRISKREMTARALPWLGLALILFLSGHYPQPEFSLGGWFVPLVVLTVWQPRFGAFWLAFELAGQMAGLPGFAAAAGSGLILGEKLSLWWQQSPSAPLRVEARSGLKLQLPYRLLIATAAVAIAWLGVEPGESVWNRRLLVAAQQQDIAIESLFQPLSLTSWVERHGHRIGLSQEDLTLAAQLRQSEGEVTVLTPTAEDESLEVAAVLATLSGRPLSGWHADPKSPELYPAPALARHLGQPEICPGQVVIRGLEKSRLPFPSDVPAPGCLVDLGETNYQVSRNGKPWGRPVASSYFLVPLTPGQYEAGGQTFSSRLDQALAHLEVTRVDQTKLPSRSLTQVHLALTNPSQEPISLDWVRRCRLWVEPASYPTGQQAFPTGLLQPGQTLVFPLWLTTSEQEGIAPGWLELEGPRRQRVRLPLGPIRTWRRLPPVGTWPDPKGTLEAEPNGLSP